MIIIITKKLLDNVTFTDYSFTSVSRQFSSTKPDPSHNPHPKEEA